jgi:riboflavin-specific deaminase-like protein
MLRGLHAAIAVGVGTVIADDPRLTCRDGSGDSPLPVVFDTHLQTPPSARLFDEHREVVFVCSDGAREERGKRYSRGSARFVTLRETPGRELSGALRALRREYGLSTLMVEGGATLLESFLRERLFDLAAVTVAPRMLGGYQLATGSDLDVTLIVEECVRLGEDLLILASPGGGGDE